MPVPDTGKDIIYPYWLALASWYTAAILFSWAWYAQLVKYAWVERITETVPKLIPVPLTVPTLAVK